jgi:glycogen debranching enzyme
MDQHVDDSADAQPPDVGRQPWLHELEIAVDGPTTSLSSGSGQIGGCGTGVFVDDRRVVSVLRLRLGGHEPSSVAASSLGACSQFWTAARNLGASGPDPTIEVHRRRTLQGTSMTEQIRVVSRADTPVVTELEMLLAGDGAEIADVKAGAATGIPTLTVDEGRLQWCDERHRSRWRCAPQPTRSSSSIDGGVRLTWPVHLEPHGVSELTLELTVERTGHTAFDADAGSSQVDWDPEDLAARVDDPVLAAVVRTGLTDLRHLTLRDPDDPDDLFVAAGTPWYLTLFGRDSIWAARMMLPYSRRLAAGTLRALARRQAGERDPDTAAEPGKILHEVRRTTYHGADLDLSTRYYGTVDATPLWVVLLVESWEAGMPEEQVRGLLPNLRAALSWMGEAARRSPDGMLRYLDESGTGLANQGWKDSGDSMRRADGTVASAPIALLEAQAYAVEAAGRAGDLLDALGEEGGARWRAWGGDLAERVRAGFWVEDVHGTYPAMALDADGKPVDGVGSNMGHALGTGLLDEHETAAVVARLMQPDLLREFGIGTLSRDNPAYNPVGYHTGSVWTHDSAIIVHGLARTGHHAEARRVADALLRLGLGTRFRLPELCAGESVGGQPVPYPASCRPQGWAAASAAVLLTLLAGRGGHGPG